MRKITENKVKSSFRAGWYYGKLIRMSGGIFEGMTNGEVEIKFPTMDVQAFQEGLSDGLKNDRFRLKYRTPTT